jgi:hypothetical protein
MNPNEIGDNSLEAIVLIIGREDISRLEGIQ